MNPRSVRKSAPDRKTKLRLNFEDAWRRDTHIYSGLGAIAASGLSIVTMERSSMQHKHKSTIHRSILTFCPHAQSAFQFNDGPTRTVVAKTQKMWKMSFITRKITSKTIRLLGCKINSDQFHQRKETVVGWHLSND